LEDNSAKEKKLNFHISKNHSNDKNNDGRIFLSTCNLEPSATIGWQSSEVALWGIKEGYKNAADSLVEIVLNEENENNIRSLDTYIFPTLFLYRQSLEVSLKLIFYRGFNKIASGGHNLSKLWEQIYQKIVLDMIQNDEFIEKVREYKGNLIKYSVDDIDFNKIKAVLTEIQSIDKKSDVFRYMIDNNGKPYMNKNIFINYLNLRKVMEELYSIFDYMYEIIDEYLSG
jgi:HEPN domain-containing protein